MNISNFRGYLNKLKIPVRHDSELAIIMQNRERLQNKYFQILWTTSREAQLADMVYFSFAALRIHMSEAAHLALGKHRVYHMLRRGQMEIKVIAQFLDRSIIFSNSVLCNMFVFT